MNNRLLIVLAGAGAFIGFLTLAEQKKISIKTGHWVALGAGALLAIWLWNQAGMGTGGFNQPQAQPQPDDDLARLTDSAVPHCHPQQFHAGYVYTPHRYPRVAGGEITALIHRGYSTMRVPNQNDVQWLIAPPSEVMF